MSASKRQAAIVAAHDRAAAASEPGYLDPVSGLFVLTSAQLAKRGHCCGNGCRHCPYPRPEQQRAGRPEMSS